MYSVTQKHYLVYKITNKINDKFYIGCHETYSPDDSYMGSGKLIKLAIKKYGLENFNKKILFDLDNSEDMFTMEKEQISKHHPPYNIHEGGNGGWKSINTKRTHEENVVYGRMSADKNRDIGKRTIIKNKKIYYTSPKICKHCSAVIEYGHRYNSFCRQSCAAKYNNKVPRNISDETRKRISDSLKHYYRDSPKRFCANCNESIKPKNITGLCGMCLRNHQLNKVNVKLALKMRYEQGMTYEKIADFFGVTHPTILNKLKK